MPKKSYVKRDTMPDRVLGGRYFVEERNIELLISTIPDGDMNPRSSSNALSNYRTFLEKHGFSSEDSFSPAIGLNYRIITIDESNEERYVGQFVQNGTPPDEFHCDAVIIYGTSLAIAFRVGDCPVALIFGKSPKVGAIMALVHIGRAELVAKVLEATIVQLSDLQMHLNSATAYIFPHICKHCYELEVLDPKTKKEARGFWEFADGLYHLDLFAWLKSQLKDAGIKRISKAFFRCTAGTSPVCVSRLLHDGENFKGFFSNYASHHRGAPEGRFLVVARIIDEKEEDDKDDFYEV